MGISFAASQSSKPLDGRVLLLISTDSSKEPREQISDAVTSQQVFGVDVDGLAPATEAIVSDTTLGYPTSSLAGIKAGDYWVQGLLHVYETFHRGDGKTVKLPAGDRGEGQQWPEAPGNLYSKPVKMHIDPSSATPIHIVLDQTIPPIPLPPDTKYVKHFKVLSDRLTKFWGRPVYLGAILVLPEGFDTHPDAHYPLAIYHGHFQSDVSRFPRDAARHEAAALQSRQPHRATARTGTSSICARSSATSGCEQEKGYEFYKEWTGPGFPRVLLLTIQHPTPYYDDSYAVNSENNGPYGDAITYELIPYVESHYRGLGAWARAVYGGSTGGWEALGVQVKYPEDYNGAWANCPDPIDFHAFTTVDLYHDGNAFYSAGPWRTTPRPAERDYLGRTRATMEQSNQKEAVLGSKTRSGGQWDIWEAVFSPAGAGWLSEAHLRQAHRRDRLDGRGVLARQLRSRAHHAARLGDARTQAARQDHAQRRPLGQLLPERRRVSRGGLPQEREESAGGCDDRLRRARRALLERRPREREHRLAAHVPPRGS